MKTKFIFLLLILVFTQSCKAPEKMEVSIIPEPKSVKELNGDLELDGTILLDSRINSNQIDFVIEYLKSHLTGFEFKDAGSDVAKATKLVLSIDPAIDNEEGYRLSIDEQIEIIGATEVGVFYGVQSLLQLFPAEIYSDRDIDNVLLQKVNIEDAPRFGYRGMHLDVCRHFFPVEFVKKYIDFIAYHKMNRFHWHLTEDQGWRIEIKKYPKLTEIGGFRKETMGDGEPYGGYYTQDEIKEVVKYAQTRFVEIVPEIEMPGHATAALAAYPQFACTEGPFEVETRWGIFNDIFCAGKENTFEFLEDVLSEVIELFPGEYVHIGGDEAPKLRWENCDDCQKRIKSEGLKDEHELQSYFVQRVERFLSSKGKKLIGWDEILEGGLAPDATVMSWRGIKGGVAAAKLGHDVVMTPTSHCYFDYYQSSPKTEPISIGGFLPISKVYNYEPIPGELNEDEAKFILGAQANVWTEYMPNTKHVEYMVFPRIAAISEVAWTQPDLKSFSKFAMKLNAQFKRYDVLDINYSKSMFNVSFAEEFDREDRKLNITLDSEIDNYKIKYDLNNDGFKEYSEAIRLDESASLTAALFDGENQIGESIENTYSVHKAFARKVDYKNKFHNYFPGNHEFALVDGITGSKHYADGNWQGFDGKDLELVIDLGTLTRINTISMNFLQRYISWIFLPRSVEISFSADNVNFEKVYSQDLPIDDNNGAVFIHEVQFNSDDSETQFVKVFAKSIGVCPEGHPREGEPAWLFIDEIKID